MQLAKFNRNIIVPLVRALRMMHNITSLLECYKTRFVLLLNIIKPVIRIYIG